MITFDDPQQYFAPYVIVDAQSGQIGLMSCLVCGAVVMMEPGDGTDLGLLHYEWHKNRGELPKREAAQKSSDGNE